MARPLIELIDGDLVLVTANRHVKKTATAVHRNLRSTTLHGRTGWQCGERFQFAERAAFVPKDGQRRVNLVNAIEKSAVWREGNVTHRATWNDGRGAGIFAQRAPAGVKWMQENLIQPKIRHGNEMVIRCDGDAMGVGTLLSRGVGTPTLMLHHCSGLIQSTIRPHPQQRHTSAAAVSNQQRHTASVEREITRICAARSYGIDERQFALRSDTKCTHTATLPLAGTNLVHRIKEMAIMARYQEGWVGSHCSKPEERRFPVSRVEAIGVDALRTHAHSAYEDQRRSRVRVAGFKVRRHEQRSTAARRAGDPP